MSARVDASCQDHTVTDDAPRPRVVLRPLGDPLGLGLFAFGIGMLMLAAQSTGWVPASESEQVGLLLAAFVFPLEGVAALLAFLARDTMSGTVLGIFTTSWLALGLHALTTPSGATSHTLGIFLIGFGCVVATLSVLALAAKPLIAVLLALSSTRAVLYGLSELVDATGLRHAAGYVALAIVATAWYAGVAFLLEETRGDAVLPTLRRGPAAAAVDQGADAHAAAAAGEPGVRPQL